jgi:uncharacterized membrane protein YhaH (DUF805 family)
MHKAPTDEMRPDSAGVEMRMIDPAPVLTWRRLYVTLDGRLDRETFWLWGFLPWLLLGWSLAFLVHFLIGGGRTQIVSIALAVLSLVFAPVIVKRLHDRDRPGWLVLLCYLPVVYGNAMPRLTSGDVRRDYALFLPLLLLDILWAWVVVYECGICRGTPGPNRYGAVPSRFGL